MDLIKFSISLKLTLELAHSVNQSGVQRTLVDVMAWVSDIQNMHVEALEDPGGGGSSFRYTGTFLHQPVDLISSDSRGNLFTEQVIKVTLTTSGRPYPDNHRWATPRTPEVEAHPTIHF